MKANVDLVKDLLPTLEVNEPIGAAKRQRNMPLLFALLLLYVLLVPDTFSHCRRNSNCRTITEDACR